MDTTISFCGDILVDASQMKACEAKNGYNFDPVFERTRSLLSNCGFLVGNLETPIAGPEFGFTFQRYQFNTPIELLYALKNCGFSLLSLANNHCMDRGLEGLYATLDNLEKVDISHIGTYRSNNERSTPHIHTIGNIRFGFLSYTYGVNAFLHRLYLPDDAQFAVNLLQPEEERVGAIDLLDAENVAQKVRELYEQANPIFDQYIKPYLDRLSDDIRQLRERGAEYLIMLLHCGGQHNQAPDAYTRWMVKHLSALGVDLIICNHQHVIHPIDTIGQCRVAYCLGNFSAMPGDKPDRQGLGDEFTYLLHMNFKRSRGKPVINRISYNVLCNVINDSGVSVVWPLYDLIQTEADALKRTEYIQWNRHFVNLLSGQNTAIVPQKEYDYPLDAKE